MFSNNEVTEGLLIAVLGANFMLLFFIAWYVLTAHLYFKQVRRLAIAITGTDRKMDCDELIDEMMSCSGEQSCLPGDARRLFRRNGRVTALTVTGQKPPDRVQKYSCSGGQAGRYGVLAHGKALTASHIEELDDSEIKRLYARYDARLGAAMTKTLESAALQIYAGVVSMFLPIPAENHPGLIADLEGDPFVGHALSSATSELYHRYGIF